MMDCSQCPIHPRLKTVFTEFAKKDSDIVRAHGARPVFFMSWAYADKPEMTAQLAEAYTVAGNENNVLVIPAGLAFARALSKQPELKSLCRRQAPSESRPAPISPPARYFAALTGRSPVGNPYLAGIDEPTARLAADGGVGDRAGLLREVISNRMSSLRKQGPITPGLSNYRSTSQHRIKTRRHGVWVLRSQGRR